MSIEKDVRVNVSSSLTWAIQIHAIIVKVNNLLGLLKRTCPMFTDVSVRLSLYLTLVKSQLFYVTEVGFTGQI